jgi:hypothetical protein
MTGIQPRQQVQQLCNQLANSNRIRRQSVEKVGKRRKIHNFPANGDTAVGKDLAVTEVLTEPWRRRLSALVAATGKSERELFEEALQLLAMKVLKDAPESEGKI